MIFLKILENLKERYKDDCIIRKNGTVLLAPMKIPNCRYMLYKPLNDKYIQSYLIDDYKNDFPDDYIEFLKYSNGAQINIVKIKTGKFDIAHSLLTIYGLPLTPPYERPFDMEEPFDVRIEDLARHKDVPDTWLKCGNYTKNYIFDKTIDIFIDTENGKVYSCEKNQKEIIESWKNLDDCLCSIYNSFDTNKFEYEEK